VQLNVGETTSSEQRDRTKNKTKQGEKRKTDKKKNSNRGDDESTIIGYRAVRMRASRWR
jgi:hypothetical protein